MDIVNFDALKAQDRIIDPSQVDPEEDYFIIGKYTNHYTTNSQKYTKYPVYAIKAGDVMGAIPTLQQVLDFNHDLLKGNNYQGTGAGVGNTGNNINAFGASAAENNTGIFVNAIGISAAKGNTGNEVTAIGREAAIGNTSNFVTAIGFQAGLNNTGSNVNAVGSKAAVDNTGDDINAFGYNATNNNTGNNINAFGNGAGSGNTLNGMTIFSNASIPSYANFAAASSAITVGLGATAGCTYLYHDQATNSIGAVRL